MLVACALPFGRRVSLTGLAATLGLMVLLSAVMVPASYTLALKLRDAEVMSPVLNTITLPLLLLSGILLPLSLAPAWLRDIATMNPLSHAVETSRATFNGRLGDPSMVPTLLMLAVLAVAAVAGAHRSLSRMSD